MSSVRDALRWSGSSFVVSLFVVADSDVCLPLDFATGEVSPARVRVYPLEDESTVLGGLRTYEYDLEFDELPAELGEYLEESLRRACSGGARLAWLGFEGSFDFERLLADEVAEQIYGVCTAGGGHLVALDRELRTGPLWKDTLRAARQSVL